MEQIDNSVSRAVDFWLNNLLEGFVTEFAVDMLKAYNEVERYFFKGYRSKYPNSLSLWIKTYYTVDNNRSTRKHY